MGSSLPKQFIPIKGKPIILHTIDAFKAAIPDIQFVLVLPKAQIAFWKDLVKNSHYQDIQITEGGKERTNSVKAGLQLIPDTAIVGIHDAVRPFASAITIQNAFQEAFEKGNAIPVVQLTESLRHLKEDGSIAVERTQYRIVQTPQCFSASIIKEAYQKLKGVCTDDASVLEANGFQINLVEGNKENIKITEPGDLRIAEALLEDRTNL